MAGSGKKAWWGCARDATHCWQAIIRDRVRYRDDCPMCTGRMASRTTSLAATHPALAAEWDRDRNPDLGPEDVTPGSSRRIWWRCGQDPRHVWAATVTNRALGSRCPFCFRKRATPTTSLKARRPRIAAEWHPTLNGTLGAEDVMPMSRRQIWWRCRNNPAHVWQATAERRTAGGRCPACSGRRATPFTSLRVKWPRLAREWLAERNGTLTPDDVVPGSNKRAWWQCRRNKEHVWSAIIVSRTRLGAGCPFCARLVATPATSLKAECPAIAAEWHPTRNAPLAPVHVLGGSDKRVWWRCRWNPHHEWQASVYNRARRGSGCPACAGRYNRKRPKKKVRGRGVPILV